MSANADPPRYECSQRVANCTTVTGAWIDLSPSRGPYFGSADDELTSVGWTGRVHLRCHRAETGGIVPVPPDSADELRFPGESEDDHNDTLSLVDEVGSHKCLQVFNLTDR